MKKFGNGKGLGNCGEFLKKGQKGGVNSGGRSRGTGKSEIRRVCDLKGRKFWGNTNPEGKV